MFNKIKKIPLDILGSILGLLGISLLCYSCALYTPSGASQVLVKTCNIPNDQSGTISGHWSSVPVPIAFHQGDFSPVEISAIIRALDTWNQFFAASKNTAAFDYGGASSPYTSSSVDTSQNGALCSQGILQNGAYNGYVVLYKVGSWPYASSAIALTSFCTTPNTIPNMYMALMEINYQNYFVSGTGKYPDLTSIVLHELGHVLGLNHSCEGFSKTGIPLCTNPAISPDYISAIMFPSFGFDSSGAGQVKQTLGSNDESRVNCLYNAAVPAH